jgi:hypothetical protein
MSVDAGFAVTPRPPLRLWTGLIQPEGAADGGAVREVNVRHGHRLLTAACGAGWIY